MKRVLAVILGGGAGTRLYPLTKKHAKPAVPIAGKHRLIDIPVSNCINSDIYRIYVLTQFNSASLNQHIAQSYNFSPFRQGFVEILAAQQTPENQNWFQGTADAVRQYLWLLNELDFDEYLILSGDHLYRMDYRQFVQQHRDADADISLSVLPVEERRASDFGLLKVNQAGRVVDFSEKPKGEALRHMQVDTTHLGLSPEEARAKPYLASMGIYLFNRGLLTKLLQEFPQDTDFGKEVIPRAARDWHVQAYAFNDYWEDIGTIEAFYHANIALPRQPDPAFSFYDHAAPIYTRARYLPPTKQLECHVYSSMISEGCILKECHIYNSVIGIRSRIESGCEIRDSLIMGADDYQPAFERQGNCDRNTIPLGVGAGSTIHRAILDKNVRIGCNVKILNKDRVEEANREDQGFYIRSGIVTILQDATIADDTVI